MHETPNGNSEKNQSSRWDWSRLPSAIQMDALTTELLEAMVSKGKMWAFDWNHIMLLHRQ